MATILICDIDSVDLSLCMNAYLQDAYCESNRLSMCVIVLLGTR